MRRDAGRAPVELKGTVWLTVGGQDLGGPGRIALLEAIAEHGSITQAAKAVGLSYKAAWHAVEAMNNLAGAPLVERAVGGKGGGGTRLTARGAELVERFDRMAAVHERFVKLLSDEGLGDAANFNLLRLLAMKTSARNQFMGTVSGYKAGAVNDEVELTLAGGHRVVAIVTRESTELLGLKLGAQAFALVKASSVLLATDLQGAKLSARNQLAGTVASVSPGTVNSEVTVDLGHGLSVAAVLTRSSMESLGLAVGQPVTAFFKASSVILGALA